MSLSRRQFMKGAGATIAFPLFGKDQYLTLLTKKPFNAEAEPHLLDPEITPTEALFVRNNGTPPVFSADFLSQWRLKIDGEVTRSLELSLAVIKEKFKHYTYQLVLECGGNGRAGYVPATPGNQWTYGAVGCPLWTGVRLQDVLNYAKIKKSAVYIGYYGLDTKLSGHPGAVISRGFPIRKALDPMTLLAFAVNGKPLPLNHGFPLRLICPGFPASASGKWLTRLWVRDRVHDGAKMEGSSYRMPKNPVKPGGKVVLEEMQIIEEMPVKSLITFPASGQKFSAKQAKNLLIRGFAWSGHGKIEAVHVSYDFGRHWLQAELKAPRNSFSWQRWSITVDLPSAGYYEVWARARDITGEMQPMVVPGWNPKGYLNNAMPRIALDVV